MNFGFVRLDDFMADDLSVVNAARVSFAKESSEMDDRSIGLINFLMRERHGTPFEHNSFRFHIKCPLFVAREWFRHRIGSFNEFSARYSMVEDEFYIPLAENIRTQVGKPGSYSFEQITDGRQDSAISIISSVNKLAYHQYMLLVEMGVAKEVARCVLPVSMYTQFYWTVNARSLMNFISLRDSEHAQMEIREYAIKVREIFAEKMPITHDAWLKNGKVCP